MTVSSSVIHSETITNHSGNWSSGPLAAGTFDTLIFDVVLSSLSDRTTITLSRLDAFNNPTQMWGASEAAPGPAAESVDIGPCDGYACSRAWGADVQIDILTTGTFSGTISLQGRG